MLFNFEKLRQAAPEISSGLLQIIQINALGGLEFMNVGATRSKRSDSSLCGRSYMLRFICIYEERRLYSR